ncbi:hypothetical protein ACVW00_003453 [Marmoricola sp. URHA0025 HA25]
MPGPEIPDAPPPEVPEEFADAYREAYRRALETGPDSDQTVLTALPEVPPQEVVRVGTHRSQEHARPEPAADWRSSRWFLPVVIGAAGLALVLAAYAVGTALGGADDQKAKDRPSAVGTTKAPTSNPAHPKASEAAPSLAPGGWDGPVTPVSVDAISADCTEPPGSDSSGHKVTYVPANAIDAKADTAWRCAGAAVGEKLTLRLGSAVDVAEVGLVPGYAKTDPASGVDRYAENNRITRVRWTLADGVSVVQRLDPDASSRALQAIRVPRTGTDTLVLEILAVKKGPRNTTAISQIEVAAAR